MAIGIANFFLSKDPRKFDGYQPSIRRPGNGSTMDMVKSVAQDIKSVVTVPTFIIIITQVRRY
jgi:hypothetical protein